MRSRLENSRSRRALYLAGVSIWIGSITFGMSELARHEATPGASSATIQRWPTQSHLARNDHGASLVMFAHPRCPCTRASLTELQDILANHPNGLSSTVVFFKPGNADGNWMDTPQVEMAAAIPGVNVVTDTDGREANRFGAMTSGHTLLYDKDGNLLFSGGITMSRGHIGDNIGQNSVERILAGHKTAQSSTPVFGCSMSECTQSSDQPLKQ